jgi:hypothetical protein
MKTGDIIESDFIRGEIVVIENKYPLKDFILVEWDTGNTSFLPKKYTVI